MTLASLIAADLLFEGPALVRSSDWPSLASLRPCTRLRAIYAASNRFLTRSTVVCCQLPSPEGVSILRLFNSVAAWFALKPSNSRNTARYVSALASAFRFLTSLPFAKPFSPIAAMPFGLPSLTPFAFAAFKPSRVLSLIRLPSHSAITASRPTVNSFMSGQSAATKDTLASLRSKISFAFRDKRSSLPTRIVARLRFAIAMALVNSGRWLFLPLSVSTKVSITVPPLEAMNASTAARCAANDSDCFPVDRRRYTTNFLCRITILFPSCTQAYRTFAKCATNSEEDGKAMSNRKHIRAMSATCRVATPCNYQRAAMLPSFNERLKDCSTKHSDQRFVRAARNNDHAMLPCSPRFQKDPAPSPGTPEEQSCSCIAQPTSGPRRRLILIGV